MGGGVAGCVWAVGPEHMWYDTVRIPYAHVCLRPANGKLLKITRNTNARHITNPIHLCYSRITCTRLIICQSSVANIIFLMPLWRYVKREILSCILQQNVKLGPIRAGTSWKLPLSHAGPSQLSRALNERRPSPCQSQKKNGKKK